EVAAPRLDDGERLQVVESEERRAVTAGREAHERAPAPARDRAEAPVDEPRQLLPDRGLPVPAGPPVEVFGVGVVVAGGLRLDEDRWSADPVEGGPEVVGSVVAGRGGRQAVQEIDDRVAMPARRVVGRKVD